MGNDSIDEQVCSDEKKSPAGSKRKAKEVKSQRKAAQRRRTVGVVSEKIEIEGSTKGTKIRFDDDFIAKRDDDDDTNVVDVAAELPSDEDSDGPVEMVSSSVAKQKSMELRAAERETRREERMATKKRKRKKVEEIASKAIDSSEDELDDDFLATVDSEREKKILKEKEKKMSVEEPHVGKHTTFEIKDNGTHHSNEQNISLIVLRGNDGDGDGEEVGGIIGDGLHAPSSTFRTQSFNITPQLKKNDSNIRRNIGANKNEYVRSRKMNFRLRNGKSARNFLIKNRLKQDNY